MRHVQIRKQLSSRIAGLPVGSSASYSVRGSRGSKVEISSTGHLGMLAPKGTRYRVGRNDQQAFKFATSPKQAARYAHRMKHSGGSLGGVRHSKPKGDGFNGISDEKMIGRRTRGGHGKEQSRKLLADLRNAHSPSTLPAALMYHRFISKSEAER